VRTAKGSARTLEPASLRRFRSRDRGGAPQHIGDDAVELGGAQVHGRGSRADEIRTSRFEEVTVCAHDLAESAAESVANDRIPDMATDRVRDLRRVRIGTPEHSDRDGTRAVTTGPGKGTERFTAADASDQAESLARP
jgi:hypothetical protein